MEKVSLWIRGAKVWNAYEKKFEEADVAVEKGRFCYIDRERRTFLDAERILDAAGLYLLPGLIDIHMHIESTMMTPENLAWALAGNGVTTIVSEPHEMANVKGVRGIREMICAAKDTPIDIFYGIPSSVPSTDERLETTGGIINCDAMKELLDEKNVICVGEIMNCRQIIRENHLEITKFLDYLRRERPGYVIEGHCPSLVDLDLARFLYLGIDADHTEHTLEEVKQRIENGMFFEIQDKMLKPDVLEYICENRLYEYCCFVTDDTMADTLYEKGQLNYVVQKAVEAGFPVEMAIYCATYTPSRRMHLHDRGAIAPGKLADFALLDDPAVMTPSFVYKNGVPIFSQENRQVLPVSYQFPADFYQSVSLAPVTLKDFQIPVDTDREEVTVRAIEVHPDRTQTTEKFITMPVQNHTLDWKSSGCLLAMVLERHGKNGNIGYGFITGSCLNTGTVATTYFHDHHNLFVAGDNPEDMLFAVRRIQETQGGILTVKDGRVLAELSLPVCGILSEQGAGDTAFGLKAVRESLEALGYRHKNPVMSLGTLGLPVSPALKLTDHGLIDVKQGVVVPLIVE